MISILKTMTLSAALAVMFLSAGTLAGASTAPINVSTNVTIIHKNSIWPFKGQITSDACTVSRCVEI